MAYLNCATFKRTMAEKVVREHLRKRTEEWTLQSHVFRCPSVREERRTESQVTHAPGCSRLRTK